MQLSFYSLTISLIQNILLGKKWGCIKGEGGNYMIICRNQFPFISPHQKRRIKTCKIRLVKLQQLATAGLVLWLQLQASVGNKKTHHFHVNWKCQARKLIIWWEGGGKVISMENQLNIIFKLLPLYYQWIQSIWGNLSLVVQTADWRTIFSSLQNRI